MGSGSSYERRRSHEEIPDKAGMSRYGEPEEIAELLAFMVSPAAKWMTGSSVRMDGGEVKGI
jgi:3-oxoacyl-[acyl-carrier protein] reductase